MTSGRAHHPQHRAPSGDFRRTVRLFRRYRGGRKVYVLGVLFLLIEAVTAVFEPYPIAVLIDYLQGASPSMREQGLPPILGSERFETVLVLTVAIILIASINSAADSFTEVCMARGGRSLGYSIRVAMYSHLQRLPLGYHDKKRTGDVLTRVTGDVLVVEDFVVKSVSNILGSLMVLVGSFAFLLVKSWSVALVAVVVVPMLAFVSSLFSKRIKVASKTQRDREGDLASTAQEMLASIRLVQSYGRGTVDLEKFSSQTGKSMFASLKAANIQAEFSFVIALVEALSIAAVIWLGVWLVDRSAITVGTLVLFVLLLQNMFKPARKIVSEWYKIGKVFASVERIDDLLDREVVVRDLPDALPAPPLKGRLTFRDVSFAYPAEREDGSKDASRPAALHDIDFDLAPGEVVALVGYSGAGKSTIAQLVPRLYDPDEGQVLVDGMDVRGLTLASLRSQVSLVLQETVLLSGTVAENIGYGIADATQEDIQAAARMANAHDFIMAMPDGYQTPLGERGSTLSGGQRQRIAIARAFIRRAPILILDEPTTGLDAESAQSVVGALRDLMRGTTTVVISHDSSLIRYADRALVIAGGRIVESGAHAQLMRADGPYAALFTADIDAAVGGDAAASTKTSVDTDGAPSVHTQPGPSRSALVGAKPLAGGARLVQGLHARLPGIEEAVDEDAVARHIGTLLAPRATTVHGVRAGTFWLRTDGTCSLRYQVQLGAEDGPGARHTVLGRLHPSQDAALEYMHERLGRRPLVRSAAGGPWRTPTALVPGAGLALHAFPIDPDLPTLGRAMNPHTVALLACSPRTEQHPVIEVVHHPREGACVLRYTFASPAGPSPDNLATTFYGKVYPGSGGDIVEGFLQALASRTRGNHDRELPSFPRPVLYAPSLRLLVTDALPGEPTIPRLLAQVLDSAEAPPDGSGPPDGSASADILRALHDAVRSAGSALAALHGSDRTTAPVRSVALERSVLQADLELVAQYWPEVASLVRRATEGPMRSATASPDMVLSHGDFTPAQVLLDGQNVAVVDLDTLCWADPALDLGRFLAHLELLAVKRGGDAATPLVHDLTRAFLRGYGEATPRTAAAAEATDRIALYKTTTLARTALRACRQLKDYRVELALGLLDSTNTRRVDL